jgi:large subunit ribosomal protein L19
MVGFTSGQTEASPLLTFCRSWSPAWAAFQQISVILAFPTTPQCVTIVTPSSEPFDACADAIPFVFPSCPCRLIMSQQILQAVESPYLKEKVDEFGIGDTVDVHTKIQEGSKERIQIFSGTVIARSGSGSREMFVVRRIVAGEGVERKFPVHSPKIEKIEVKRRSVVRRAKLYFLRERTGKGVRLRERRD